MKPRKPLNERRKIRRPKKKRPAPLTGRMIAFKVLSAYRSYGEFLQEEIEQQFASPSAPHRERGFVTELTGGVVRRQQALNKLLSHVVSRPMTQVEPELWTLLQMGAYQLCYMDGTAEHAAIHETVELARRLEQPRWTGILNGCLRSLQRLLTNDFTEQPDAFTLPHRTNYRRMNKDAFPNPATHPLEYISDAFSLPLSFVRQLDSQGMDFAALCRLGFALLRPTPLSLRINEQHVSRDDYLNQLTEAGHQVEAGTAPQSLRVLSGPPVHQLPGYAAGWFTVQDESAMSAADLLNPQPNENVLDLCAAPGTKTVQMGLLMRNAGHILACDIDAARLEKVTENAQRMGLGNIETRWLLPDGTWNADEQFDAVLVDVPCSNTGVLGKRAEARWRLVNDKLPELTQRQQAILQKAIELTKPGGRLVYSTCSIDQRENEQVVASALAQFPHLELVEQNTILPDGTVDGAFTALIKKQAPREGQQS